MNSRDGVVIGAKVNVAGAAVVANVPPGKVIQGNGVVCEIFAIKFYRISLSQALTV